MDFDLENDIVTETVLDPTAINTIDPGIDPTKLVATTRRVQVKLTADKLMDEANGIPYLTKTARKQLRISKNKPTLDNLNNIVKFYQIWAHRVFPRAKFYDFILLARQLGKKDRILRDYRMSLIRKDMGIEPMGEENIESQFQDAVSSTQVENNDAIANSTLENINQDATTKQTEKTANLFHYDDDDDDDEDDDLYHIAQSTSPLKRSASKNSGPNNLDQDEDADSIRKPTTILSKEKPTHTDNHNLDNNSNTNKDLEEPDEEMFYSFN